MIINRIRFTKQCVIRVCVFGNRPLGKFQQEQQGGVCGAGVFFPQRAFFAPPSRAQLVYSVGLRCRLNGALDLSLAVLASEFLLL